MGVVDGWAGIMDQRRWRGAGFPDRRPQPAAGRQTAIDGNGGNGA
jgi:hypothetical protein